MPTQQSNVLLLLTDQQTADAIGVRDESFYTPNLDRLANTGARFENCYSTHPQCSPARSSIVTGQYPHQTNVVTLSNWGPFELDSTVPSVGRIAREADYETAWFGKWHLGQSNTEKLGWETHASTAQPSELSSGELRRIDERTTDAAVKYLEEYTTNRPFFVTVSYQLPHPPWFEDKTFSNRYTRDDIDIPPSFDDDLQDKPSFHRERAKQSECDLTADDVKDIRYKYRTMVSRVDKYIGRVLDVINGQGYDKNTHILFSSDHGDMQGAHRLNKKGVVAYDELLRVPLVIRPPETNERGKVVKAPVSIVAIPSTIAEIATGDVPDVFETDSLCPRVKGRAADQGGYAFFEHKYAYWGEYPYVGVRTPRWKYVRYLHDDVNELYDLEEDPHEIHNLATDPNSVSIKRELDDLVKQWWQRTDGDWDRWEQSIDEMVQTEMASTTWDKTEFSGMNPANR